MKVLVTGGAGFIGSNLVKRLLDTGSLEIVVIDDLSSGQLSNISPYLKYINFIKGSILDNNLMSEAINGVDTIFHLAAKINVEESIKDPVDTNLINLNGTLGLLELANKKGVRRFIFSSSAAVYGNNNNIPLKEDQKVNPLSPYGLQKYSAETYGRYYSDFFGLSVVSLRYFNVYGPNQQETDRYAGVIYKFINMALKNGVLTIDGTGEQTRDFIFVDDVVSANILAMKVDNIVSGKVYNVGTGKEHSILNLHKILERIMGHKLNITKIPSQLGDIQRSSADISKIKKDMGFSPSKSIEDGLLSTIEWVKNRT